MRMCGVCADKRARDICVYSTDEKNMQSFLNKPTFYANTREVASCCCCGPRDADADVKRGVCAVYCVCDIWIWDMGCEKWRMVSASLWLLVSGLVSLSGLGRVHLSTVHIQNHA